MRALSCSNCWSRSPILHNQIAVLVLGHFKFVFVGCVQLHILLLPLASFLCFIAQFDAQTTQLFSELCHRTSTAFPLLQHCDESFILNDGFPQFGLVRPHLLLALLVESTEFVVLGSHLTHRRLFLFDFAHPLSESAEFLFVLVRNFE